MGSLGAWCCNLDFLVSKKNIYDCRSGIHHFVFIYLIKLCGLLRISEEVEKKGMDMALCFKYNL